MGNVTKEYSTDVLVIGSGYAGSFAAIRAKELGADVLMVEQGKSGYCGMSPMGTHRFRVVHPDDDFDRVMEGTVLESEYMIDQEYLEVALKETWDRFQDLLKLGILFRKEDSGEIAWQFDDTDYPWHKLREAVWEPMGSYRHHLKIKAEVIRRGVTVVDRIFIAELMKNGGKVQGAIGYDTKRGDVYLFRAKAVVMATGNFAGGGTGNRPSLTGDGIAMAARAGAELRGLEFAKAEVAGVPPPGGGPVWIYSLGSSEKEVTITNARGEEFLEQYELARRYPGRRYFGPPWRVQLMAVLKEIKEGRGPCFVDYRAPNKSKALRESYGSLFDCTVKQIELTGNTLDKIKYELGIVRGLLGPGGIRINKNGETSIPGLYAGGIATDLCGAVQYSYLSAIPGSMVTGHRAGESAAKYALAQSPPALRQGQIEMLKKELFAPLGRQSGLAADDLPPRLRKAWLNVDIRNERNLTKARQEFHDLKAEALRLRAENLHELTKVHKIGNYIECSDAVAAAALARRETRLEHIRDDYPLTDNKEWLKWVIIRRDGNELLTSLEEIPIQKWKYRPERTVVNRLKLTEVSR